MSDPNEELPVTDVFDDWHAIGLIARLDREHGNIKAEIEEKVDLTGKPLKTLLDNAIDADLIEEAQMRAGDHPRSDRYQLTKRGKAIQWWLRLRGLDEVQRKYIARKNELQEEVPTLQAIIEEEGLHLEYPQQDYWAGSDDDKLDRDDLRDALEETESYLALPDRPGKSEYPTDVIDEDDGDLGPKETWGAEEPDTDDDGDN